MRAAQEILPILQIEVVEKTVRSENAQVQCIPEVLSRSQNHTFKSHVFIDYSQHHKSLCFLEILEKQLI
jgi:hypothetical protein